MDATTITLGGKERRLILSPETFRLAEIHGKPVPTRALEDPSLADLSFMVWVGLLRPGQDLDEDTVIGWMIEDGSSEAIAAVTASLSKMAEDLTRAMGKAKGGSKGSRKKPTQ